MLRSHNLCSEMNISPIRSNMTNVTFSLKKAFNIEIKITGQNIAMSSATI